MAEDDGAVPGVCENEAGLAVAPPEVVVVDPPEAEPSPVGLAVHEPSWDSDVPSTVPEAVKVASGVIGSAYWTLALNVGFSSGALAWMSAPEAPLIFFTSPEAEPALGWAVPVVAPPELPVPLVGFAVVDELPDAVLELDEQAPVAAPISPTAAAAATTRHRVMALPSQEVGAR